MENILVSGLINLETTLQVEGFPIPYNPVNYPFFGVNSSVSGVGFNVAKALTRLGDSVAFLSLIGQDPAGQLVHQALAKAGIQGGGVLASLPATCQSVILYDRSGRRQIYTDLKDIQEKVYPIDIFEASAGPCRCLALCNINFSRPMLQKARSAGKLIATDLHTLSDLDDEYNHDFMQAADILFMSDERLPTIPEDWVRRIWNRFGAEIVVIGMGAQGALLGIRSQQHLERFPAVYTRPIISTIGAGDALFSAFLHTYLQTANPRLALQKALVFASYKIGETSAAEGFLDATSLEDWFLKTGRHTGDASTREKGSMPL
jgi:acarbose 7IV-phosphotransferase